MNKFRGHGHWTNPIQSKIILYDTQPNLYQSLNKCPTGVFIDNVQRWWIFVHISKQPTKIILYDNHSTEQKPRPEAAEGRDTQPKKLISRYFLISEQMSYRVIYRQVQRSWPQFKNNPTKNNPVLHPINPLSISEQMSYRVILWTTFRDSCPRFKDNPTKITLYDTQPNPYQSLNKCPTG